MHVGGVCCAKLDMLESGTALYRSDGSAMPLLRGQFPPNISQ